MTLWSFLIVASFLIVKAVANALDAKPAPSTWAWNSEEGKDEASFHTETLVSGSTLGCLLLEVAVTGRLSHVE